ATRTRRAAAAGAKIVVWSEAAAFLLKEDEPAVLDQLRTLARQEGIYLQAGLNVILRTDHYPFAENRALMVDPTDAIVWNYFKTVHPFGDVLSLRPAPV
ncbi:MAG TPA: hypothetical protein PKE45_20615, partial [Caldilineaceae bacterium]|nr:hypothetical protein [Caldilineaceae bacterium]